MINSPLTILDNTGCFFKSQGDSLILGAALAGYSGISTSHNGLYIPYLCRSRDQYEVGTGIVEVNNGIISLRRIEVLSSSSGKNPIAFADSATNHFYCFANSLSFRTGLNNLVSLEGDFEVSEWRSTYLIDISNKPSLAKLPPADKVKSLVVEFQTTDGNYSSTIISDNDVIATLGSNTYCKLISTGSAWLRLNAAQPSSDQVETLSTQSFFTQNTLTPSESGSVQYNDGTYITGSNIYIDSINNKILLGNLSESLAHTILSTSGNSPTVFNNTRSGSDFIVRGSGDKSLFFGYEGRLGVNIPSGSRPQTVLHLINNACQEGIRLENRNQCYPSNLTLYHKPSTVPANNSIVGTINLSAKNSSNNQVEFAQLRARALSANATSTSGEFAIAVDRSGILSESFVVNANSSSLIANNNRINVSTSGIDLIGQVRLSSLRWSGTASSGQILMSDSSGNIILTNPNNSSIIDLLDPGVIVFTGVCT